MEDSPLRINDEDFESWLASVGVEDSKRAAANLREIASKVSAAQCEILLESLPQISDPDRAINNLERFVVASHLDQPSDSESDVALGQQSLGDLMTLLATSQYLSALLVRGVQGQTKSWSRFWHGVWSNQGQLFTQASLIKLLVDEINVASNLKAAMKTLRQFKHRQTLRIGVGDLIAGHRIEQVTTQISFVANAIVESSYRWARNELAAKHGQPKNSRSLPSRFVVLALGKLGGTELNYSSDIDLVMVYDESGTTGEASTNHRISNQEFYERLCRRLVKLIGETTELGATYRVDLRLRPNGGSGKICNSYSSMTRYYDLQGRTWERQALIKATPIAGDLSLGRELLDELSPWIYRRNLSRADIGGVKALKRKIERRALETGEDKTNVKTGHGGIRDVEFIIQFMQLLNGGDLPQVRTTNTLDAIRRLEKEQCLSPAESTVLVKNYAWLRKLEHRLQMMYDTQTHSIPSDEIELMKLAKRIGFSDSDSNSGDLTALEQFKRAFTESTESNRRILDHLLHGAFGMAFGSMRDTVGNEHRLAQDQVPLEVDLILDPEPDAAMVESVLRPYGFRDVVAAHKCLMDLAKETTQFLSGRRCKHFLASVAPALLNELAQTPDPDASLVALAMVSDCLGAKGVLWELFSFNPPTLSLYVRLCASSDYLVGILRSNPGMIDELVDALQLDGLPTLARMESSIEELTKGAQDLSPILHSFKNTQHMRVGIRDILGRDDVRDTHRALSDVAEVCLRSASWDQYAKLLKRFCLPERLESVSAKPCPLVILGLGKLGGREPNYHSDVDVIFLYDQVDENGESFDDVLSDGATSQFFFSELAAAITKFVTGSSGQSKLYEIDSRLRPTGKSGSLAVSMDEFKRYFDSKSGQLWERQALCKARPIFGSPVNVEKTMVLVEGAITQLEWKPKMSAEIRAMRLAMQKNCTQLNLKRGIGGTVDVEFAIQMLQLRHAGTDPNVLVPGTLESIEKLAAAGFLDAQLAIDLSQGYQMLRSVEARLRLMNTTARHDLPRDEKQLEKLAFLLNYSNGEQLAEQVNEVRQTIRTAFDQLVV